jgi:hypothetical protein
MTLRFTLLAATAGLLALGGCASDDAHFHDVGRGGFGRGGGGDASGVRREGLNVFISPAGKPYRAGLDEPYPSAAWFAAADLDHDGRLSPEEFRKDAEAFFHELDTNHDGVIDGFEVQAYEQKVAPEILPHIEGLAAGEGLDLSLGHGRDRRDGPDIGGTRGRAGGNVAGDQRPEGAGLYGLLNEPEPVAATDTAFDSHITLQEFKAAADRRFIALDSKRLGYLTLATLPQTPAQIALERERKRAAAHPAPPK